MKDKIDQINSSLDRTNNLLDAIDRKLTLIIIVFVFIPILAVVVTQINW